MYPVFSHHIKSPYLRCVCVHARVCSCMCVFNSVEFSEFLGVNQIPKKTLVLPFSHTSCECSGVRSREMFLE